MSAMGRKPTFWSRLPPEFEVFYVFEWIVVGYAPLPQLSSLALRSGDSISVSKPGRTITCVSAPSRVRRTRNIFILASNITLYARGRLCALRENIGNGSEGDISRPHQTGVCKRSC